MLCFFFQAEDGIRDYKVTGVQTCALPLPTLSCMSVSTGPGDCLRHRCSSAYLRISLLHAEFHPPLPYSSHAVTNAVPRLSPGISHLSYITACARFTPDRKSVV